MLEVVMGFRKLLLVAVVVGHTERIEPRMELHAARMTLIYHELKRIEPALRRLALLPAQIQAPRLKLALVEGVGTSPDLEEHGVDVYTFGRIENRPPIRFHAVDGLL